MENNCKGETAQKSIAEMENEVKEFNEKLKPIQEWFNAEKRKRLRIAQSSSEHDNAICPICGKSYLMMTATMAFLLLMLACVATVINATYSLSK